MFLLKCILHEHGNTNQKYQNIEKAMNVQWLQAWKANKKYDLFFKKLRGQLIS